MTEIERRAACEHFISLRKEAGLKIDPATAVVRRIYAYTVDPYGIDPEHSDQVDRQSFARSPESDIWVAFDDLPQATRNALAMR